MTNIENNICEAIELIVDKTIQKANYDKTVQGVIQSCEDAAIGKYRVKYQDSIFYAYSTSTTIGYNPGTLVYILIPGDNMLKDKTILGTVDKLGTNYIPQAEGEEAFDIVGKNCIVSKNYYELSSFIEPNKNNMYIKPLYYFDPSKSQYTGDLEIDLSALKTYLNKSDSILFGATIQTDIDIKQFNKGDFGLILDLDFKDRASNGIVTRQYLIDADIMTGNPYNLKIAQRQYGIFKIDGTNFDKISSISLFVKDFPEHKKQIEIEKEQAFDIKISNLELVGMNPMSQKELSTCGISFYTPEGTIFTKGSSEDSILPIIAQVKIKGKLLNTKNQQMPFYWFQEDASITNQNSEYNVYGGRGWRCLNQKNIIKPATQDTPEQVEWVPATDTYNIHYFPSKEIKLKCVILYNENLYSKTIIIQNFNDNANVVKIISDSGTQFYYDVGRPTLTCLVNNQEDNFSNEYDFVWGKEDANGVFSLLSANEDLNKEYEKVVLDLENLKQSLLSGEKFFNAQQNELANAQSKVDAFNYVERVQNNKIMKVAINEVTGFATYKCSVFKKEKDKKVFLGTDSITLSNSLEAKGVFRLIINNGTQEFQYNEYGISPTSRDLVKPQKLAALTFSIVDDTGNKVPEDALQDCDILWKIPYQNSMVLPKGARKDIEHDDEFYYFKNTLDLSYEIQSRYNLTYKNNNISLIVKYQDKELTTTTNFHFLKTGESGTNGTSFSCKILPNNKFNENLIPVFTVVKGQESGTFNFHYGYGNLTNIQKQESSEPPFKVQVFKSGELIFDGTKSGQTISGTSVGDQTIAVEWSFLRNKYKAAAQDDGYLTIEKKYGKMTYEKKDEITHPAHILKCAIKLNNTQLFATLPIIFVEVANKKYNIALKENTGFQSVIYTADGVSPKYDNTKPFEIEVYEKIQGVKECVSLLPGDKGVHTFIWDQCGQTYDYLKSTFSEPKWNKSRDLISQKDTSYAKDLKANQMIYKPINKYDGLCVNNAIKCSCGENGEIGYIHIPIHLMLNKYGFANLNDWDGNSIQLDEKGGFILSPQIGAGFKNKDNQFTGLLMGEVQRADGKEREAGLFAYNNGLQTIKLNAKNGSAIFGPTSGQIVIDPTHDQLMLYSSNYWKDYNDQGLPLSYDVKKNKNNNGMLIDLNTPMIDFGNGNFQVNSKGFLTAKGGGSIAGWNFDDTSLFTNVKNLETNIQLSTQPFKRKMKNTDRRFDITEMQKTFGIDNVSYRGELKNIALAFGQNFAITQDGSLFASSGIFQGEINTKKDIKVGRNIYLDYDAEAEYDPDSPTGTEAMSSIGLNYSEPDSPTIEMWKNKYVNQIILSSGEDDSTYINITKGFKVSSHVSIFVKNKDGKEGFFSFDDKGIHASVQGKTGTGYTGELKITKSLEVVGGLVIGGE